MTSSNIDFVYQNQIFKIKNPDSNEILLNYIRTKLKKIGSKNGCSEGGCGACTVVLGELKKNSPAERLTHAEKLAIENPSTLRKQEILFAILKKLAQKNEQITGGGVLEVLQDGFGFLRAIESNYLPGPDDV